MINVMYAVVCYVLYLRSHAWTENRKGYNYVKDSAFYWRHKILYALGSQGFNPLQGWMERLKGVGTIYLDNYLYWFRWLELGKNLAFDKRVEQMLISACQKSNYKTVELLKSA